MRKLIRLTENDLHRIIEESVREILAETDASAAGGGALGGSNLMVGTSDESGGVVYPFGGKKNNGKVGGNPFNQSPLIRKPSPVGEPSKKTVKGVDMSSALSRGGSISVNRVGESIVREAVDESIGNWLRGAALGGMMAMTPMQANAQQQNYNQNDSIQTTIQQTQQMSIDQLKKMFPKAYKDRKAKPKVWKKNQMSYIGEVNGKMNLIGKIAASHGQNPWDALVKRYCPQQDNIFQLSDFDI